MSWRLGVDIGGTFTDLVLSDETGVDRVTFLAHATTVVTNALLEGKGARTALVTTCGFRDVLELRRSARASLYDLFQDAPAVLVPRHHRLEVRERVDAQGAIVQPLAVEDVDEAIDFI